MASNSALNELMNEVAKIRDRSKLPQIPPRYHQTTIDDKPQQTELKEEIKKENKSQWDQFWSN